MKGRAHSLCCLLSASDFPFLVLVGGLRRTGARSRKIALPTKEIKRFMTSRKVRGFSLLELMIVIAIGLTMASVTFISLMPMLKKNHVDQAYDTTLSVMRNYRNQAITQSKRYILVFTAGTPPAANTITVQYWGYAPPPAASPAPVTVSTIALPQDMEFGTQAGFPATAPDIPGDNGSTAVQFNACAVLEGGNPCVIFYPDGSAQDDQGNFNNGLVYITQPSNGLYTSRAITMYGTTGRIRGWRLYSQSGVNVWVQQ
jgi:prepilin-type N-terminal cleavage/methylation domain-containing protein